MATPVAPRSEATSRGSVAPPATASADWTVQVADTIESVVGSVRNKTAVPLETIARTLVYGIIVSAMGITALVLGTILSIRVLSYVLQVWAAYAVLGGLFTVGGMFFWRKRRPKSAKTSK